MKTSSTSQRDIWNLLIVLGTAVALAVAVAAWTLSSYGPTGSYDARGVLLSPSTLSSLAAQEVKKGAKNAIFFERIDFAFYDQSRFIQHVDIPISQYGKFYDLVSNGRSLSSVPTEVEAAFSHAPSTLIVHMHTEGGAKLDQMIDFLPEGDYYRVRLHEQATSENWAVFYHPGIGREVLDLFAGKNL